MARALIFAALLLETFATQAASQVRVDARFDKDAYLQGEPVTVVVDILNTGDEAFADSKCDGRVTLTVSGVERRVAPDISGCVPPDAAAGEWRLLIGSTDGTLPLRPTTTVRVR